MPGTGLDAFVGYKCAIHGDSPDHDGLLIEKKGRGTLANPGQKIVTATDGRPWITGAAGPASRSGDATAREWRELRIVARGNRLRHWIDGRLTVDVVDLDERGRALGGVLALRLPEEEEATVRFKDIRIRHLPDALPILGSDEFPIPEGAAKVRPLD